MQTSTDALSLARTFFGAATMASGVLQLATGGFVRLVPKLPPWVAGPSVWASLVGIVLVALGLAILSGRRARPAASLLGAMILLMVALLWVPELVSNPEIDRPYLRGFMWTNPLKALALVGGAALLAGLPGADEPLAPLVRAFGRIEPLGPILLAVFLIVCGIQHFVYGDFVVTLVPSFMPAPKFWADFTGVALIAGGTGILVPKTARVAAALSALMIFLWVLLLHIPRALAGPHHANETAGVFEALAVSGVALAVAGTRSHRASGPGALPLQ